MLMALKTERRRHPDGRVRELREGRSAAERTAALAALRQEFGLPRRWRPAADAAAVAAAAQARGGAGGGRGRAAAARRAAGGAGAEPVTGEDPSGRAVAAGGRRTRWRRTRRRRDPAVAGAPGRSSRRQYDKRMADIDAKWPPRRARDRQGLRQSHRLRRQAHRHRSRRHLVGLRRRRRRDGWNSAAETFNVTLELVRRGYTEEQIAKIWSGNLLRVWGEVEKVAKDIQSGHDQVAPAPATGFGSGRRSGRSGFGFSVRSSVQRSGFGSASGFCEPAG